VVHDGVETSIFHRVDGSDLRSEHARGASHVLIFHGAIDPQDDPGLLIDAARLVLAEHQDVCFWLVGDGSAVPDLKRKVSEYSLGGNFYFSGWVEQHEIPYYISASDVGLVVLPDVLSARGRVTLKEFEYWACGVPAVLPRLPALEEVAQEGVEALFYQPDDAKDLASKISRLLEDGDLRTRLGEAGLSVVKDMFEWAKLADQFVVLCEDYVQGSGSLMEVS
jgi:glycosyltransferase involved in cell wall biosynthesis